MKVRATTILGVRLKTGAAMGGDGQVTFGDMALKQMAVKVRSFEGGKNIVDLINKIEEIATSKTPLWIEN